MSIHTIIDIVLSLLALLIVIKFTARGFLRSILDTLKVPVALAVAYIVRIPVAKMIDSWFMQDGIIKWVKSSLLDSLEGNDSFVNFIELYKDAPKVFTKFLAHFGLGDVSQLAGMETASNEQVNELATAIGSSISMLLSTVLAVVCLFIVNLIILAILVRLLDGVLKIGAIKVFNIILGFALGLAIAVVFLWGASFLMDLLVDATDGFGGHFTEEMLNDSMIVGIMKEFFN